MNDKNYHEQVNPTYNTAQLTLHMLASAGNEEAVSYLQNMDIPNGLASSQNAVSGQSNISADDQKRLMTGATLGIEARYAAISRLLAESNSKCILDIACGYTPRALTSYKNGYDYVGFDVPVVVEKMNEVAEKLNIKMSHDVYISGDATNPASLLSAASCLGQDLFITSEGLLQYLSENELIQLIEGIKSVLKAHGGVWYSSDMEVIYDRLSAAFMNDPQALAKYAEARSKLGEKSNIYFESAHFKTLEEKINFFEKHGLAVERVPFYTADTPLKVLYAYPEKMESVKKILSSFYIWKMTLKDAASESMHTTGQFTYSSVRERDTLSIQASGRIDTLSAPALLKIFEKEYEQKALTEMIIDAASLEYISSAGLRTLMIAVKKMGAGSVKIINANDTVKDIFAVTGFDSVVTLL